MIEFLQYPIIFMSVFLTKKTDTHICIRFPDKIDNNTGNTRNKEYEYYPIEKG